jgi:RimJ/RimL family protein N-acetyltransferase
MNISVRETIKSDLEPIFRIRKDSLVAPSQFRLPPEDNVELWRRVLFHGPKTEAEAMFGCSTILANDTVIGHVSRTHSEFNGKKVCYCGWNIAPAFWGRGFATTSLEIFIDSLFQDQIADLVLSDCFSTNDRCLRLIAKLNYKPGRITLYERLVTAVTRRSLHWVLRFYLTADLWQTRKQEIRI